jgi:hypothetical protein
MEVVEAEIADIKLLKLVRHADPRGFLLRSLRKACCGEHRIDIHFVQGQSLFVGEQGGRSRAPLSDSTVCPSQIAARDGGADRRCRRRHTLGLAEGCAIRRSWRVTPVSAPEPGYDCNDRAGQSAREPPSKGGSIRDRHSPSFLRRLRVCDKTRGRGRSAARPM